MKDIADKPPREQQQYLLKKHPVSGLKLQQVDKHIDDNVTDLASAKEYIKVLTKLVLSLQEQQRPRRRRPNRSPRSA